MAIYVCEKCIKEHDILTEKWTVSDVRAQCEICFEKVGFLVLTNEFDRSFPGHEDRWPTVQDQLIERARWMTSG